MSEMRIETIAVNYQRNGICGEGFWTVRFTVPGMEQDGEFIAVMPADALQEGGPGFERGRDGACFVVYIPEPEESWRGDHFADAVRQAINEHPYRDTVMGREDRMIPRS